MENYVRNADLRYIFKYLSFSPINKNINSTLNIIKIMVLIKLKSKFSILSSKLTNKRHFLLTREKYILIFYLSFSFHKRNLGLY